MRVFVRTVFVTACICVLISLSVAGPALAASVDASTSARYDQVFDAKSFKLGQDALKYEMPESGMFKIMPRLSDSYVFTRFDLPEDVQLRKEWSVTATVYNSESPAAGVGLWNGDKGYAFYVFPDGRGRFQYFEGNKTTWTSDVKVINFSYPARITLERDPNGNFIARVNGVIVAVRIFEVDLKKPKLTPITAASFVTHSTPKRSGAPAYFEKLEVSAWGAADLMDSLKTETKNR